jgi:phage shock protein PspC (stress-responsive transcriptional regulator)
MGGDVTVRDDAGTGSGIHAVVPAKRATAVTNGTLPPSEPSAPTAPPPAAKPPLRRPRDGRILGGVCLGVARHLGVDVVLVRIVVVVLTIASGGVAAIAYLLGLVFIDAQDGTGAVATADSDPTRSREPLFYVGIGLLVVGVLVLLGGPFDAGIFGLGLRPGVVLPLVLVAFGIALWRSGDRRAEASDTRQPWSAPPSSSTAASPPTAAQPWTPAAAPAPATPASPGAAAPAAWQPDPRDATGDPAARTAQTAPTDETTMQTDTPTTPLAPPAPTDEGRGAAPPPSGSGPAAPPSGSGPAAAPGGGGPPSGPPVAEGAASFVPPPAPARERSLLGRLTLGVALLTSGVLWTLDLLGLTQLGALRIVSAGVLVLGLGLLVGSFLGRGRWLAIPAALLAPLILIGGILPAGVVQDIADGRRDGFGELVERPLGLDDLQSSYQLGAGTIEVDLTALDVDELLAAGGASVSIQMGAGEVVVLVPDDVAVEATARAGAGEVLLFSGTPAGTQSTGSGVGVQRTASHQPVPDAPVITLDVQVGLGVVDVRLRERTIPAPDTTEDELFDEDAFDEDAFDDEAVSSAWR